MKAFCSFIGSLSGKIHTNRRPFFVFQFQIRITNDIITKDTTLKVRDFAEVLVYQNYHKTYEPLPTEISGTATERNLT